MHWHTSRHESLPSNPLTRASRCRAAAMCRRKTGGLFITHTYCSDLTPPRFCCLTRWHCLPVRRLFDQTGRTIRDAGLYEVLKTASARQQIPISVPHLLCAMMCRGLWIMRRSTQQKLSVVAHLLMYHRATGKCQHESPWYSVCVILGFCTYRYTHCRSDTHINTHTHTHNTVDLSGFVLGISPSKTPLSLFALRCDQSSISPQLPTLRAPQTITRR